MKIKIILLVLLLAVSAGLLTSCIPDNGGVDNMNYAAKAREIVDDLYINDGTDEDAAKIAYIGSHFYTILDILGIEVVDDPAQITPDGPVSLTSDQVNIIISSIYMDLSNKYFATGTGGCRVHYVLDDFPDYLVSSGLQIEREAGYGNITADDLKGVMDYYTELYDNNTTIKREYFAGYLIGAINRNNLDAGSTADQYSLDKLQMFLFKIDAFTLPEDSPLAASVQNISRKSAISISAPAGGTHSNFGAGAKRMKIKPENTRQKVIDILDGTVRDYVYNFSLTGSQSIKCGDWLYTASVRRTCRWTEGIIDPGDCSGMPEPVEGINVDFTETLQEHGEVGPLPKNTKDQTYPFQVFCDKKPCPKDKPKSKIIGSKNVNGYVEAKFTGTDPAMKFLIFPATAILDVTERIDTIECYK